MDKIFEALSNNGFATADYLVFIVYIIILVGMGLFLSRTKKGEEKSSTDYFLAGNTLTWWAVGASLIAANISAEQFIGMSGSAFASGIAQAAYELMAAATLLVVGKFLLPLMIEKKIFTIPQFLRERYNWGVGFAFSLLWLFLYVFVNLTSVAWLGALAIQQILGLPTDMVVNVAGIEIDQVRMCIILSLFVIAGIYSIYGGLASVAWTDVMQVTFLVGGGLITAYAALSVIGDEMGLGGAWDALAHIKDYLASIDGDKHFNLVVTRNEELYPVINGVVDMAGNIVQKEDPFFTNPGIVLIFGALWLTNLGYWGFNQYIIQKGLAAKSLDEAKKGMVFAAFLKILIPFIVCIPGVCAFYIMNAPECEGLRESLAGAITRSDDAYPFLIRNFTPTVVKGLSFAALAAAVISSLASMFNSTSTLFTMDIYKQFINKNASEKKLVNDFCHRSDHRPDCRLSIDGRYRPGLPVHSGVLSLRISRCCSHLRSWSAVEACQRYCCRCLRYRYLRVLYHLQVRIPRDAVPGTFRRCFHHAGYPVRMDFAEEQQVCSCRRTCLTGSSAAKQASLAG